MGAFFYRQVISRQKPLKADVDTTRQGDAGSLSPLAGLGLAMTALLQNLSRFSNTVG
jgi:hypothetical protein